MLITLIPQTAGYENITLDGIFSAPKGTKRASEIKLLNGGKYLFNEGYELTDMVFNIVADIVSDEQYENLDNIFINDIDLLIEDETSLYKVFFNDFDVSQGVATIELWVTGIATDKDDIEYPDPFVPVYDIVFTTGNRAQKVGYLGTDRAYYGWGLNSGRQVKPDSISSEWRDTDVILTGPFIKISTGFAHTLLLSASGNVYGFGDNTNKQANPASATSPWVDTTNIIATNCIDIACGYLFSMALKSNGDVVAWGDNEYRGANPLSATDPWTDPTNVIASGCTAISAGNYHALALKANGDVVGWGGNFRSQANPLSATDPWIDPTNVILSNVSAIQGGDDRSMFINTSNGYSGCGYNHTLWRALDPTNAIEIITDATNIILPDIASISSGFRHTCVIDTSGNLFSWGENNQKEADPTSGDSHIYDISSPRLTGMKFVIAGLWFTACVGVDDGLYGYGYNPFGAVSPLVGTTPWITTTKILDLS